MSAARRLVSLTALVAVLALGAAPAHGADTPLLQITSLATPTNFKPNDASGEYTYDLRVANLGAAPTDGTDITIADTLPAGVALKSVSFELRTAPGSGHDYGPPGEGVCSSAGQTLTCTLSESIPGAEDPALIYPGEERRLLLAVIPGALEEGQTLVNQVSVSGGGSQSAALASHNQASSTPASGGISFWNARLIEADGTLADRAATHPYQAAFGFAVHTKPAPAGANAAFVPAGGDIKDIRVPLPAGLSGASAVSAPRCSAEQFSTTRTITINFGIAFFTANECPPATAVGVILVQQIEGVAGITPVPIYNLDPAPGMPAQFGAQILNLPFYLSTEVRPSEGFKVVGVMRNLTQVKRLTAASVLIWGTPADARHDSLRATCINQIEGYPITLPEGPDCEPLGASKEEEKPLLRLPTGCGNPLDVVLGIDSWSAPGSFLSAASPGPVVVGCNQVPFNPTFRARPTTTTADSPTGIDAALGIPQRKYEDRDQPSQADLRDIEVTLPKGIVINPSGANGLNACGPAQIGLSSPPGVPPAFNDAPAACPDAARLGTVAVSTPVLDRPLKGSVYAASPYENPFGTLIATYITIEDPILGIVVKLAGRVDADPATGQIRATFAQNPQVPFEDVDLNLFSGPFAVLRSPQTCGAYATNSLLTPYSAPESGPPATSTDSYAIDRPPAAGPCAATEAELPFAPAVRAGSSTPIAGAQGTLVINLRREDGSQELAAATVSPPPGLIGKIAQMPYCPQATLDQVGVRSGRAELAAPSCPAASQVGTVNAGAGAGPAPYYTSGKVYLAPPYKGAPLSMAIVTPATAGPFDLGTVLIRIPIYIDRESGRITAVSDPLPRLLSGIPLDVRSVSVRLDRPDFIRNPTSCDPMSVDGTALSFTGRAAPFSNRFQVGECGRLKFAPKLSLRLRGGTRRGAHPSLRAVLTSPRGDYANLARLSVALPHSEFLDTTHIRTICTRVQFAASNCPKASIYGHVKATSPLVDYPVEGPVYLRSSSNPLPDVVMTFRGPPHQPLELDVVARIDSVHGGTRATVANVPDLPLARAVLTMQGGKKGLFQNSRNVCASTNRATVKMDGQNGKVSDSRQPLQAKCAKRGGKERR